MDGRMDVISTNVFGLGVTFMKGQIRSNLKGQIRSSKNKFVNFRKIVR